MSLALYRRYRPQSFKAVAGQEATLQALTQALDQQRLHHAYLFTGTRGVGKTTLARLLAKALNCLEGVSANPCGVCAHCVAIQQGSFPDLIEIDAASRTKVEDTRELMENVHYIPSQGRYKVYLIDEVHMLSGHSFNALLKTLEEPPAHVIFLFATTDPQKLPATVLSRCLQFHLSRLSILQISAYLQRVLNEEGGSIEAEALTLIAEAADGSLRDALTLTEQALAYGNNTVTSSMVREFLGLIDSRFLIDLLQTMAEGDPRALVEHLGVLAKTGVDYSGFLKQLLEIIHQLSIIQYVPEALDTQHERSQLLPPLAQALSPQTLQLYYQIALQGQRDLPYAPSPQMGFEMTVFRMMAFQPVQIAMPKASVPELPAQKSPRLSTAVDPLLEDALVGVDPLSGKVETGRGVIPEWPILVHELSINGLTRLLAEHCVLEHWTETGISLLIDPIHKHFVNTKTQERLSEALNQHLGKSYHLRIHEKIVAEETPATLKARTSAENHQIATQKIEQDPTVQQILQAFDAEIEQVELKTDEL